MADNDNNGGGGGPMCILRHGRKSHTWGELRQATQHTVRDPAVSWLGDNIAPERSATNMVLVGTGDVVADVRTRLAAVGLEPKAGQVVARELLVTASHAYFGGDGHTGRDGDWNQDRLVAWRTATVQFLQGEFGANLVTVTLHLDESVPHAHVWVTTAVNVQKNGRGRPRKDGTKAVPVMGWTLNHDKVMGSGKEAFAARQDRYADAMEPLGLKRGQRQSKAHHKPIRKFYAELEDRVAAAEAERQAAREIRLQAEQDAIRADILRQGAEHATLMARQAQQAAEASRKATIAARTEAEEARRRAVEAEQEQIVLLANVKGERDTVEDDKRALGIFVKAHGIEREFDQWRADTKAVAALRQNKGPEWGQYEKSLAAYATDLNQYATLRDIIVRRADRHLRFLLEVGAMALGHSSIILGHHGKLPALDRHLLQSPDPFGEGLDNLSALHREITLMLSNGGRQFLASYHQFLFDGDSGLGGHSQFLTSDDQVFFALDDGGRQFLASGCQGILGFDPFGDGRGKLLASDRQFFLAVDARGDGGR